MPGQPGWPARAGEAFARAPESLVLVRALAGPVRFNPGNSAGFGGGALAGSSARRLAAGQPNPRPQTHPLRYPSSQPGWRGALAGCPLASSRPDGQTPAPPGRADSRHADGYRLGPAVANHARRRGWRIRSRRLRRCLARTQRRPGRVRCSSREAQFEARRNCARLALARPVDFCEPCAREGALDYAPTARRRSSGLMWVYISVEVTFR